MELLSSEQDAKNLYKAGILDEQSYLAFKSFKSNRRYSKEDASALANLLFEDLNDPQAYKRFIKYCKFSKKIRKDVRQLTLLGKQ